MLNSFYLSLEITTMTEREKGYKKLYRLKRGRMLAGVCAGLAEYFNIDPTIIRLLFVGLALAGGSAILVYVLMWLIVPSKW